MWPLGQVETKLVYAPAESSRGRRSQSRCGGSCLRGENTASQASAPGLGSQWVWEATRICTFNHFRLRVYTHVVLMHRPERSCPSVLLCSWHRGDLREMREHLGWGPVVEKTNFLIRGQLLKFARAVPSALSRLSLFTGKSGTPKLRKERRKSDLGDLVNIRLFAHLLTLWVKWCEFLCR